MNQMKYPVNLRWSDDDDAWIAEVPDLPGCMADGPTEVAALREAAKVVRMWIQAARKLGRPVPPPTGGDASGKFVARVPKSLHRRLQLKAKRENVSLSCAVKFPVLKNKAYLSTRPRCPQCKKRATNHGLAS